MPDEVVETEATLTCISCLDTVNSLDDYSRCGFCRLVCRECQLIVAEVDEYQRCVDCTLVCASCINTVDWLDLTNSVCSACRVECENCGTTIHCPSCGFENAYGDVVCGECYEEEDNDGGLHDYRYVPYPNFLGTGPRYYGVELEIDNGDVTRAVSALELLGKGESLFYLKSDGSLSSDGIEIVTHPASLKYHRRSFPWAAISAAVKKQGYTSHDASSCGLHIHVSRKALGKTHMQRELTISKLILLIWKFWKPLVKLSRRSGHQMSWCQLNYDESKVSMFGLNVAKTKGKYVAINVEPRNTIEFRLFRGTLNVNSIIASIQALDVMIDMALDSGISWVANSAKWEDFIEQSRKHKELTMYLQTRNFENQGETA